MPGPRPQADAEHDRRSRRSRRRGSRGASLLEYVLLVGLVALVAIAGLRVLGGSIGAKIRCQAATLFGEGGESCGAPSQSEGVGGGGGRPTNPSLPHGVGAKYEKLPGQPFVVGDGDGTAVHPSDISQGTLNDCYVLSSFAAIAARDPAFVEKLIRANKDGTYTVTFQQGGKKKEITVTAEFPVKDGKPVFAQPGDGSGAGQELWPLLVEKAYAKLKGGYGALANGGRPFDVLKDLTGKPGAWLPTDSTSFEDLADRWKKGDAITANTRSGDSIRNNPLFSPSGPLPEPLVGWHIYYVVGVDSKNQTVTVRNPWGWEHKPMTLTWEQYKSAFEITQTAGIR